MSIHQPPGPDFRSKGPSSSVYPLHDPVLGARHGSPDDLAVDQLDPLVRVDKEVGERCRLLGFHRRTSSDGDCRGTVRTQTPGDGQSQAQGLRGVKLCPVL